MLSDPNESTEYRYVVVGGGSAGCWLARQLAERQGGAVAICEAGPASRNVRTIVPNFYPRTFGSSLDWQFSTVPQLGLGGRRVAWPRGKLLGGSGAINALIYLQAAEADFVRWGWTWSARCLANFQPFDTPPQPLSDPHPWSTAFVQAATQSGLKATISNPLRQSKAGYSGLLELAQHSGQRLHTGQTLHDIGNLHVRTNCTAQRVVIKSGRAIGIEVMHEGRQVFLGATDEVILCLGSIGTPLLLMQSGVGDAAALRTLGVPCIHDLVGVGSNLQDHLVLPVVFQTRERNGLARRHSRAQRVRYRQSGTGSLASNIAEAAAFSSDTDYDAPRLQIHFTPTHYLKYPRLATENNHLSLAVSDLHPRSRGRLAAYKTPQGTLAPLLDPQYLSDPRDIERMIDGIAWARCIAEQPALAELILAEELPGNKRRDSRSLARFLQAFAQSIYHPVGTCRMASNQTHEASVVDCQFRVHALERLRIADASVLPDLPSGNTNAVTLLIAQRAADAVLD